METTDTRHLTAVERFGRFLVRLWRADARPLRFAIVGGTAALLQLVLLAALTDAGWHAALANVAAYLLSAQVNFALSTLFAWHDRHLAVRGALPRRWLRFHGSITGTFALNQLVFLAARTALPTLVASALGIICAALINYLVFDRVVFRPDSLTRQNETLP